MKSTCLTLLLLGGLSTFAQKPGKFYDYRWKETDVAHARFYSVMQKTDSGWYCQDYYLRGPSLQMEGWYEDSSQKIKNGRFSFIYPDKRVESGGRYLHNKKQGLWLTYHPNGMMADSTVYEQGNPVGTSMAWYSDGSISDSSVYQADGSGVHVDWFLNGNPSSAGMLTTGYRRHGKWQFFHSNGKISAIELYDHGKLVDKNYFDETGQPMDTTNNDRGAKYKGSDAAWLKYLDQHLEWPAGYRITKTDEAVVEISLTVDEDGKILDPYVSIPFYPPFEKAALDVIARSPKWVPAISHNRRVRAHFRQAVTFKQPE